MGYALVDLLAIIVLVGALGAIFLPLLSKARGQNESIACMRNHAELIAAWTGFAADGGTLCNNFTIPDIENSIVRGTFQNWANNIMTWGASTSTIDRSVTNVDWARRSVLAPYASDPVRMCKCPADRYLSRAQQQRGWKMRLRSVAMNALMGRINNLASSESGRSWVEGGAYRQFLKMSDIPQPAKTWVFLDEHPDSINDGFFVTPSSANFWGDVPGALHNGSTTFSFADGHVELRKWRSSRSRLPVRFDFGSAPTFDAAGRQDFEWYKQHTGYVRY